MSVVNKMLQDLEARQSQTNESKADYQAPPKKQSKLFIMLLLILAIAAIIFALTDIGRLFGETKNQKVVATQKTQSVTTNTSKEIPVISENAQKLSVKSQNAVKPPSDKSIVILPGDTFAQVRPDDTSVVLPRDTSSEIPVIDRFALENPNIEAESSINGLANNTIPQPVSRSPSTKASERPTIHTPNVPSITAIEEQPSTQDAVKQPSSFSMTGSSQENTSNSLQQRIVESLNNDNLDNAQALLYQLLKTEPDNIKARKKLASLLFAQGNYAQTKQLLVQGIEQHPEQTDLRLMLARLHMVQKQPSQAINILTEFQPSTGNRAEYLGYRAALAQQLKQPKLAKSDYQVLTNIASTNAKWWLGLGIAEDQLGNQNGAVLAYKKALALDQLDSSVNDFMQQRISIMAGTQ